jgi:hypothetical protein
MTTRPIDAKTTIVRFNSVVRKFDDEEMTATVAEAFVKTRLRSPADESCNPMTRGLPYRYL